MSNKSAVNRQQVIDAPDTSLVNKGSNSDSMNVRISSPFKEYYNGDAISLTAVDATGPFDILPHHHNFISLLLPSELIIRPVQGGERKILISGGLMHVKSDEVTVFLDI